MADRNWNTCSRPFTGMYEKILWVGDNVTQICWVSQGSTDKNRKSWRTILHSIIFSNIREFFNSLGPSDAIWRQIWANIGSSNGLLPDGTKPLPEPMLTYQYVKLSDIYLRASSQEITQPSITESIWKIKYLKFHSSFSGAIELTQAMPTGVCNASHNPHASYLCRGRDWYSRCHMMSEVTHLPL